MPRFLAIDIDAGAVYVAAGTAGPAGVAFDAAVAATDDVPPLTPATAAALGQRLKALLHEAKIAPAPALVCLGRDRVVVKEVRYPPGPPAQEPALVRFQAQKDLTESPDDVVMDYEPAPQAAGEATRRAAVVFLRRELDAAARQMCEAAGLKLQAIVPRPYAAAAGLRHALAHGAVPPPDDAAAAVAHLGVWNKGGEFAVVAGPRLLFSRTISGASLASEAALVGEVKRSLAAYAALPNQPPVQALAYCEGDVPGGGWAGRLQSALPLPVHPYDPLAAAGPQPRVPDRLRGRFYAAAGLLAGKADGVGFGVNFAAPRSPRAEPSKNRPRVLVGILLAVLVLGVGFVLGRMAVGRAERDFAKLTAEKALLDEETTTLEFDSRRLAAADDFTAREVSWIDFFYDLNDEFPSLEKMRLQEMSGALVAPPAAKPPVAAAPAGLQLPGTPAAAPPPVVAAPKPPGAPTKPGAADRQKLATVKIELVADDETLPQKLTDTLNREPAGVGNAIMQRGGLVGATGSKVTKFTINADVLRRRPEEFSRRIPPPPPPPKAAEPAEKPAAEAEPFVGPPNPDDDAMEGGDR